MCGVISDPQPRLLARLVHLEDAETVEAGLQELGILDLSLMCRLCNAQRAALFLHSSPRNDFFANLLASVYVFFLRINRQEIVRVEIPEWVAKDADAVDKIRATVLSDAETTGYSHVLSQAHYWVVTPHDVANGIQVSVMSNYWQELGMVAADGVAKRRINAA